MIPIDTVRKILAECVAKDYKRAEAEALLGLVETVSMFPELAPSLAAEAEKLAQNIEDGIKSERVLTGAALEKAVRELL